MSKPICVKCKLFYRPKKNGIYWIEGMPLGHDRVTWAPYKLWAGDLWECKGCGHQIIHGSGFSPIAHQHEPDFTYTVRQFKPEYTINDC